jgi:hypothetical protein
MVGHKADLSLLSVVEVKKEQESYFHFTACAATALPSCTFTETKPLVVPGRQIFEALLV